MPIRKSPAYIAYAELSTRRLFAKVNVAAARIRIAAVVRIVRAAKMDVATARALISIAVSQNFHFYNLLYFIILLF